MKHVSRRALLGGAAIVPVALAGCTAFDKIVGDLPEYAKEAQTVAKALGEVATSVAGTISATAQAEVQSGADKASKIADQIVASVPSGVTPTQLILNFADVFNGVVKILGLNVPGKVGVMLQLGMSILPGILAAAGVALAPAPAVSVADSMSPAKARAALEALL